MIPARSRPHERTVTAELAAAAACARDLALAVSVVLPREPTLVAQARAAAEEAGVLLTATLRAHTVCLRFTPRSSVAAPG
jgi:hypothetical protein